MDVLHDYRRRCSAPGRDVFELWSDWAQPVGAGVGVLAIVLSVLAILFSRSQDRPLDLIVAYAHTLGMNDDAEEESPGPARKYLHDDEEGSVYVGKEEQSGPARRHFHDAEEGSVYVGKEEPDFLGQDNPVVE